MEKKSKKQKQKINSSAVERAVQRVLAKNQELKYAYYEFVQANVSSTGTFGVISNIPQGDTVITRDGDSLVMRHLAISWDWIGGAAPAVCRLLVFQWHTSTNQFSPTLGQLLLVTSAPNVVHAPYNPAYKNSYTILADELCNVDVITVGTAKRAFKKVLTGYKREQRFITGATTGYDQIFLFVVSDLAGTLPSFRCSVDMRFTDS